MENQKKKVKRLKGFTLGEMVTTVTIIGSLTAIAVPNYLRVRMEVNMEMVRQELRTIQKHMNDLLNRDKRFPQDINKLGNTPEEQSITGSLSAIDLKDYTTDGYRVDPNLSNYNLTTCPTRLGISGDKCFTVDTFSISSAAVGGVGAVAPWDGAAVPLVSMYTVQGGSGGDLHFLATTPGLTDMQRAIAIAQYMVGYAYHASAYLHDTRGSLDRTNLDLDKTIPSITFGESKEALEAVEKYGPQIYEILKNVGIHFYFVERTREDAMERRNEKIADPFNYYTGTYAMNTFTDYFDVGFALNQPVTTLGDDRALTNSASEALKNIYKNDYRDLTSIRYPQNEYYAEQQRAQQETEYYVQLQAQQETEYYAQLQAQQQAEQQAQQDEYYAWSQQ